MAKADLQLAGWAAVINAALTIPLIIFQLMTDLAGYTFLSKAIRIVTVVLFIFVFLRLKSLLLDKSFESVDG
jgi:hypothetical protein